MKRFICMLLVLCLVAALPLTAFAAESGECGEGITWTLDGGTLTISGSGKMADFTDGGEPWAAYKDTITAVKFGEGVTHVGNYAFKGYDKITSVSFAHTGKVSLGVDCLRNCKNLKRIDFAGRFPKFMENCLWDTYATLYYPANAPWPADTIAELENAFSGRIEFRGSDGSDPVTPTEATQPKPTEATKPPQPPQTVDTTPATSTVTAPTWSVPEQTTVSIPTFSMPEFTQPDEDEGEEGGFSGWIAIVVVVGVLAAFAAVTIHIQQVQRRKRRRQRRQRPNFQ